MKEWRSLLLFIPLFSRSFSQMFSMSPSAGPYIIRGIGLSDQRISLPQRNSLDQRLEGTKPYSKSLAYDESVGIVSVGQ